MKNLCKWLKKTIKDFPDCDYPWEVIDFLKKSKLKTNLNRKKVQGLNDAKVFCGKNVEIQPYVLFSGRVVICDNTRIGPYSFLRGPMIIGKNCLIGPYCEITRTILQDNVTLAHKNIIGDSILCSDVYCAGLTAICNHPIRRSFIKARYYDKEFEYKNSKYGALIENNSKIGALTIIMPGTHIYANKNIIGHSVVTGLGKIKSMVF